MEQFKHWVEKNRERIQRDYFDFLRFKSISTDAEYKHQTVACAKWVEGYLRAAGLHSELIETVGYPVVWGENLSAGPNAHTLLIYGHYDVQPVDPLELWKSDPFEPTVRGGQIYARGALDDKGQIIYAMLAALAFKELGERLPINLKFCIEGEEESGSLGLSRAAPQLRKRLQADSLLVPDFSLLSEKEPAISLGARGIVTMEVTLTGSNIDLHSGGYGGLAYNPNRAMVELLAKLWDEKGRVQVPGFYEGVQEMSEEEKDLYSYRTDEAELNGLGICALGGERGYSMMEANWFRPTLEINGLGGGYTGAGFKTVIPSITTAKISCRLVPGQNPEKIANRVVDFLKKNVVEGIDLQYKVLSGEEAFRGSPDSKIAQALSGAYTDVMGVPCHRILTGGSIPIIARFQDLIEGDVVGMGYGLPQDNIHAPNEHFDMNRLCLGLLTVVRTIQRLENERRTD